MGPPQMYDKHKRGFLIIKIDVKDQDDLIQNIIKSLLGQVRNSELP